MSDNRTQARTVRSPEEGGGATTIGLPIFGHASTPSVGPSRSHVFSYDEMSFMRKLV
jgi:hypothetical protein